MQTIMAGILLATSLCAATHAANFEEQRRAVMVSPAAQPESAILSLLKTGIKEGKPTQANAAAQKWLRQNMPEDEILLYYAGRAAELSGDWEDAIVFYRQYLRKADLESEYADNAVYAVYTLYITGLRDVNNAYAFSRNEGNRLLVCQRAKQFDKWFLDLAVKRNDVAAVAKRLNGCIKAGLPTDLLVARYHNYFSWLLPKVKDYSGDGKGGNKEIRSAVKEMNALMPPALKKPKPKKLTSGQQEWIAAGNPKNICQPFLSLSKDTDVAATAAAIDKTMENLSKSPVRVELQGLNRLGAVKKPVLSNPKVLDRILDMVEEVPEAGKNGHFGLPLIETIKSNKDPVAAHRAALCMWIYIHHHAYKFSEVKGLAESLLDSSPSAASTLARTGMIILPRTDDTRWNFKKHRDLPKIEEIEVKAAWEMNLVMIPVGKTDPTYDVYRSQAEWQTGKEEAAWELLDKNWNQFLSIHRKLNMEYLMWALQRLVYSRNETRQEALITKLRAWAKEKGTLLSLNDRVRVEIAYGDIAVQRGQLEEAHKIFRNVANNEKYKNASHRPHARIRQARVERMTKNYDAALQTLSDMQLNRDPKVWAEVRYAQAEIHYELEEYDDAADKIDSILMRNPEHTDAKILHGKIQLKRKKLMEATELEIGTVSSMKVLVPGEKLKVTLNDPTLAVSGAGTEIEVVVWATSGDRERFFLRQFGDEKTKFRGEVETALGAPNPGDRTLQIVGDDEIYYGYSERFLKKMSGMEERRGGPITVASDALLMASARKLLSASEQRVADLEAKMGSLGDGSSQGARIRAANYEMQRANEAVRTAFARDSESQLEAIQMQRMQKRQVARRVKPGNPIYVRVVDPDRSRTKDVDELAVSIDSSSGDSISRAILKETGTHTGWFEVSIPTAKAQARAIASSTAPGLNPNMAISPDTSHPPWRSADKSKTEFEIDLNDNVALGELKIVAREPGEKLKRFALMTGMNNQDLRTVATYPHSDAVLEKPWHPSYTVVNDTENAKSGKGPGTDIRRLQRRINHEWIEQNKEQRFADNVAGIKEAWFRRKPDNYNLKGWGAFLVFRFRGYFYETGKVKRKFYFERRAPKNKRRAIQVAMAVDGRRIARASGKDTVKLQGEIQLEPGLHRFEIWAVGWSSDFGHGRDVKLRVNLNGGNAMVDCPDKFFDPAQIPKEIRESRPAPPKITANKDGTEFTAKFDGAEARLINLFFIDQQGSVPVVNKIMLSSADGKQVLPVQDDYLETKNNNRLEIMPGDKIGVHYTDDRFVTQSKRSHERFLEATFSDAKLAYKFIETREKDFVEFEYQDYQLQFVHGQPIHLTINDSDMDVSSERDKVEVVLQTHASGKRKFEALEVEDDPGNFRLKFVPVEGSPKAENEIQVAKGGLINAVYRDEENVQPGVPVDRKISIRHAVYKRPKLRLAHSIVEPIDYQKRNRKPEMRELYAGFASRRWKSARTGKASGGLVKPRWDIKNQWLDVSKTPEGGFAVVEGKRMFIEVEAPHLALRSRSKAVCYVQTDAGREAAAKRATKPDDEEGNASKPPFDTTVPGTVRLEGELATRNLLMDWKFTPQIPIYTGNEAQWKKRGGGNRIFAFSVPLIPGVLRNSGAWTEEDIEKHQDKFNYAPMRTGLVVKPGEKVHVGFRYEDENGVVRWRTGSAKVLTHPVFDVMDAEYRSVKNSAFVGDTLCLRVVDLGADLTHGSDKVEVLMQAKSGAKHKVELLEMDTHTGVFVGKYDLAYSQSSGGDQSKERNIKKEGFPVTYGDVVGLVYKDSNGIKTEPIVVNVQKGADGKITPFSKTYSDPDMATRTQFTMAECHLQVAKHFRALNEKKKAELAYSQAKEMLMRAMDLFRDPQTRAHAEYLLGNLTQEEAEETEDAKLRQSRFRAALSRYMTVANTYEGTIYASKAQFKIATVYEKLDEPDVAAQEYVKLAYKYPDSEFLATAMARLGTHFQRKAATYEKKSESLLAKKGDKDAQAEGQALKKLARKEYLKAADIFKRIPDRFPENKLAGKAGLRSGQLYLRAGENRRAINTLLPVTKNEQYDGIEVRSQAMYWIGICYEAVNEAMAAYSTYKRLTYDFPESKWASYARAQLSQPRLLDIETEIEIQRVEEGR